jgi:hypothetical protein
MKNLIVTFFIIFLFIFVFKPNSYGQTDKPRNIVYVNLAFSIIGVGGGIYYERMLGDNVSLTLGTSITITPVWTGDMDVYAGFPLIVNYMTSNKNKFEIGGGTGLMYNISKKYLRVVPAGNIGYRYQEDDKGFIYKVGALFPANVHIGSFAVGYNF